MIIGSCCTPDNGLQSGGTSFLKPTNILIISIIVVHV